MADAQESLRRGLDWLIAQQAADGGWHSTTYGQLKDGASVTALVLEAISHAPAAEQQKHLAAAKQGYAFLDRGIARRRTVASPDGSLDFPTYATALYLTSRDRLRLSLPAETRKTLVDYLLGAQVAEGRGFKPDSPSYGGWDFLGRDDAQGITTGTNISVTRYVLVALAAEHLRRLAAKEPRESHAPLAEAIARGKAYVLRCQQPGGGFAFTCEPASLNNKAAYADEQLKQPRPYATASCDGILSLAACGLTPADEPIAKAVQWLQERPGLELVPGFEGLPPEAGWGRGLRFYYYAALAEVTTYFTVADHTARNAALAKHLAELQAADGHWVNESDRMRENDPLVATALAAIALGHLTKLALVDPESRD
jgi:hypothetical protein